jgi:hypothetical protein
MQPSIHLCNRSALITVVNNMETPDVRCRKERDSHPCLMTEAYDEQHRALWDGRARAEARVGTVVFRSTNDGTSIIASLREGESDLVGRLIDVRMRVYPGVYPTRARHLLEGGTWKECRQCQATLRQVAIRLRPYRLSMNE